MKMPKRYLLLPVALLVLLVGWPVHAEEGETDDEGFPASSVARLIVDKGSAWVLTAESGDWEEYQTNSPIAPRTRINIPEGSEAELAFHNGQYMLLTGGSEIDVRNLTDGRSSFRLKSGEIRFDLPEADFAPVRVALPGGGFAQFPGPGKYWLTVVGGGDTQLVVRRGEGTVTIARGEYTVHEGEEATIGDDVRIGPYAGGAEQYASPPPLTDYEQQADVPPAAAYELREYGEWITVPTYGVVWRPRVATGWTPYFYGSWVWISPFGWTWVSYEPWGWWPYHYGWWYWDTAFGWYWCPFRSFVSVNVFVGGSFFFHRATFFPATVRFVPEGRTIRWVPLRPGERFVRPTFTRVDTRLTTWNRPLARGTVFTRQVGKSGTAWREWRDVHRGRNVVVRTERPGRGQPDRFERRPLRRQDRMDRRRPFESGAAVPPSRRVTPRTPPERPRDYGDAERAGPPRTPAPKRSDDGRIRGSLPGRSPEAVERQTAPPAGVPPRPSMQRQDNRGGDVGRGGGRGDQDFRWFDGGGRGGWGGFNGPRGR